MHCANGGQFSDKSSFTMHDTFGENGSQRQVYGPSYKDFDLFNLGWKSHSYYDQSLSSSGNLPSTKLIDQKSAIDSLIS